MGNKVCKKCGVNYNYYKSQGYNNYDRNSCRIGSKRELLLNNFANYPHHWEYRLFCLKIY